eukprot:26380-Eustigmatos_ZCMA.PRE.1
MGYNGYVDISEGRGSLQQDHMLVLRVSVKFQRTHSLLWMYPTSRLNRHHGQATASLCLDGIASVPVYSSMSAEQ